MASKIVGFDPLWIQKPSWSVSLEGLHQDRRRERLRHLDPITREKIFHTASQILGRCPSPNSTEGSVTGLALGKVQSGKTSSFITLAAQAIDNGYKVVIVLAGTKTNLLRQNTERIREEMIEQTSRDLVVASFGGGDTDLKAEDAIRLVRLGRPIVLTVLKIPMYIRFIESIFRNNDMPKAHVLVIDDEGDQASLTSRPPKRLRIKPGVFKRTPTNQAIEDLRAALGPHAFVAYTATPQAHLLLDQFEGLSPHFVVLVEPGPGYTGGTVFHGEQQDLYVRKVHGVSDGGTIESVEEVVDSLENALAAFFVGAAIRHLRSPKDEHAMLVHISHRKTDHMDYVALVQAKVTEWESRLSLPDGDPAKEGVLGRLQKGYQDLITTVTSDKMPTMATVLTQLRKEFSDWQVWPVNSSKEGRVPDPKVERPFRNNIFIGGNMLDRGVTIPDLAVTFIIRWAKENKADTVEQRARWFGYKEKYMDLCRVWAPNHVLQGFSKILGHEDHFWGRLRNLDKKNADLMEWHRILIIESENIKPTRSSVASFYVRKQKDMLQQLRPSTSKADCDHNLEVVRRFFANVDARPTDFGIQSHLVARNVKLGFVQTHLLNQLRQVDNAWTGLALSDRFAVFHGKLDLDTLDVVWIETDTKGLRERTLKANGAIDGLLQGRSGAKKSGYPGDAELLPGRTHIQVHTPILMEKVDSKTRNPMHRAVLLAISIPGAEETGINLITNV